MSHVLAWKLFIIGSKSGLTNTLARKLGANVALDLERCTDSYGRIVKSYGRIVKVTDPADG